MLPYVRASLICLLTTLAAHAEPATDGFPFVIRSDSPRPGITDFSSLNATPAGADGFIERDGDRFANNSRPVRFWGVNLCFGANFPKPADAEKLAAHLSSLAVNCVRIHHQETQYSPTGLYDKETKKFDPAQIEQLDYLLAQLHKHGIYANLNLHVGRSVTRELGLPPLGSGHSATGDKHLLHFFPPVQEAFWQYCRDYLGHTNPHRKLRRADDPGIAMIEILNENRFHKDGPKHLAKAPEPYRSEILKQWNAWLKKTYASDQVMRVALDEAANAAPIEAILNGNSWKGAELSDGWSFNDNGGNPGVALSSPEKGTLRVAPRGKGEKSWHNQLFHENLVIKKGQLLTLSFEARADSERKIQYSLASLENGWKSLGVSDSMSLGTEWKPFTIRFTTTADSEVGKFAFDLGDSAAAVELRNFKLVRGAKWKPLPADQSITQANVQIPAGDWSPAARSAFIDFMADTERNFYRKTRALLKELGVRVPVTTTQINYQGAAMAAELADFADIHSYWHHPLFPGRNWDGDNWTIGHDPLESRPYSNQWPRNNPLIRSSWRIHGMPFTYSEWNVGEPSFPSAGAVPIMALLGSLQSWDGIFFFDYSSSDKDPHRDKINTYFSFNAQPAKLAMLGPFGQLYRSGALATLTETHSAAPDAHRGSGVHAFTKRVGIDPKLPEPKNFTAPEEAELLKSHLPKLSTPDGTASWDATDPEKAILTIDTPTVRAIWGKIAGAEVELGAWKLKVGSPPEGYGIIIATSRDGLPLEKSTSILITSVSHAGNQDFPWKNKEKTSGGWRWGEGPTKAWNVPLELTLPKSNLAKSLHTLSQEGARDREIKNSKNADGTTTFKIDQTSATLWFELSE